MKTCLLFLMVSLLSFPSFLAAKDINSLQAKRVKQRPNIDGNLNDVTWTSETTFYSGNFIQTEPNNGISSEQKTDIHVAYDDFAIYIAAKLYDNPDSVLQEFGIRDSGERNSDMFAVAFDTYNKQQNAFLFMVSAAGVQTDIFVTPNNEDENWNAVWNSAVEITADGWIVELEIPYSALRFAKQDEQTWGANFMRVVRRKQERSYWNHVDASIDGFVNQFGQLTGLQGITPPPRLQLTPYVSGYLVNTEGVWSASANGGMDLKYGINESFTLDMTLVPDFGQVVADNVVLNLSPFEVQFAENRPFFTEGTELFNKGGLFYSRRIGQSFASEDEVLDRLVHHDPNLTGKLEVLEMPGGGAPNSAPLANATKISGRTKKGIGIGFFNAMTKKTFARVKNTETGEEFDAVADPFTNFNVFVIDKNLKNNSNIGFINTSVIRKDGQPDALVSGADFRFNDKTNTYSVQGFGAVTQVMTRSLEGERTNDVGYKYFLRAGKNSGTWQYWVSRNVESDNYNPRDMGFLRAPNEVSHRAQISYNQFKPKGIFLRKAIRLNFRHEKLFAPNVFTSANVSVNGNMRFKNFWDAGFFADVNPTSYDYFEPRTDDFSRYFKREWSHGQNIWFGTDNRKRFGFWMYSGFWRRPSWNQIDNWHGFFPRFRVNNKLSFEHGLEFTKVRRELGYVNNNGDIPSKFNPQDKIPFGERNIQNIENTFTASYIFNHLMGLNLRVRHYWSKVDYTNNFYFLNEMGELDPNEYAYDGLDDTGSALHDINYNAFNVDCTFSWQFAPGSMMTVVWKDILQTDNNVVNQSYFRNFGRMIRNPQTNSISVRILYFLDYLTVKKGLTKKAS
ncbi:MAG: DUF5916 domain-containing protein [Flammeovirgaceae bacterium]